MTWSSLIGPAVVAAGVSGIVSVVGFIISGRTATRMHGEKLDFDKEQAERRVSAEISLAEKRAAADIALTERRFALDQALAIWRRRYDLAEQVLSATYEVRDALYWARGRGIFEGEGNTRVATEGESPALKEARDLAYVPIERLQAHSKAFVALQTLQDSIVAHFGREAAQPISDIFAVRQDITSASSLLIQNAAWNDDRQARFALQPFREELYGKKAEQGNAKLVAAVQQLERLLRPILSTPAPT